MNDTTASLAGDNKPPLDPPERLKRRLDLEHGALFVTASEWEAKLAAAPEKVETEEQAQAMTQLIADARAFLRDNDAIRTGEGRPYLDAQRIVNAFFGEISADIEGFVDSKKGTLLGRLNAYQRAKAERDAAERRERARAEAERAEAERRKQAEAAKAARDAEEEAERQREAVRAAKSKADRDAAAAAMAEADRVSQEQRDAAKEAEKAAKAAERTSESLERTAGSTTGSLASRAGGGASAPVQSFRNYRIADHQKLIDSLGPLGPHLSNDAITTALSAAARFKPQLDADAIPGVVLFDDTRTTIRS